jgi:hypothetical protein
VRRAMIGFMVFALTFLALSMGRAADGDEAVVTAKVSAAEHESEEGYFAIGSDATVIAKRGSELHRFLVRQNGHKVRISVTAIGGEQLSRLDR